MFIVTETNPWIGRITVHRCISRRAADAFVTLIRASAPAGAVYLETRSARGPRTLIKIPPRLLAMLLDTEPDTPLARRAAMQAAERLGYRYGEE